MMAIKPEVEKALERLKNLRNTGDLEGQLATYKELGRLYSLQEEYETAANYLEKAARVADYLKKSNAFEDICLSLIAIYQINEATDAVIDVYSRLHVFLNLSHDVERASQYNHVRLDLVAQQIGKKNPDFFERFRYEAKIASANIDKLKGSYARLLRGEIEPTVPDEYTEACYFLVDECSREGDYDAAMKYIADCERIMRNSGIWSTPAGLAYLQQLKQAVEKNRHGDSSDTIRKIFG